MDRDIALLIAGKLNSIKSKIQTIATYTIPTTPDSRSADQQRSAPAEDPEEEPEPVTKEKK